MVSYGIAWYGMVWYGMVWYGMVWYGMVWYGMVWYGMVWYGMVWYGMVWYGMVWYGMVWYGIGMVSYGIVWYGMVWYGMVWYGMVWYGMVWYGMVWYGMVWYGMVWYRIVSYRIVSYRIITYRILMQRISLKLCLLVFRCLRGEAPPCLSEMLSLVSSSDALRSHCSAARGDLIIPRTFTKTFDPRGFAVSGPTAVNSLPAYLKDKDLSPAIVRSKLKTHFFSSQVSNMFFQTALSLIRLYMFRPGTFYWQATRHSRNWYWFV